MTDDLLDDLSGLEAEPQTVSARPRLAQRLVALAEVVLCSDVPTQVALGLLLKQLGWSPLEANGALSFRFIVTLSLVDVVLLLGLILLCLRAAGERPTDLWLGRRPVWREAWLGLRLVPVVFLIVAVLVSTARYLVPALHNVVDNPLERLASGPLQAAIFIVVVIVAGGVREELQRAFLLRRFEQYLGGRWVGLIVLSTAFGLGHTMQGWDAVIATGALGAFWSLIYLRRRSSVAPIVSHATFNALELAIALLTGTIGAV